MKKISRVITCFICFILLGITNIGFAYSMNDIDYDPLLDITVTFDVKAIRALDIIENDMPDFFITLIINNQEFQSDIWYDRSYLNETDYTITTNVPDNIENVTITIQLWEWNADESILCDIGDETKDVTLVYNIKNGYWSGDDFLKDKSGYGRLNGCDDGSIYQNEADCEIWFHITQNDFDHDMIPYWMETNIYQTDPTIDNTGQDMDKDLLPIEYEHQWGFDPFTYEQHLKNDYDNDSLTTYEEYQTRSYRTDPFRKDVLIEYDFMEPGPTGEENIVPIHADDLLKNPFHRRNIVFNVERDEMIPFDKDVGIQEVFDIYDEYFLHKEPDHWRRSVFHYGLFVNKCTPPGYGFSGDVSPYWGYIPGTNGFVISCRQMEKSSIRDSNTEAYTFGSAIMHEMGHNFGLRNGNPPGCDNRGCIYPWRLPFWLYWNYKSIMNYRYTYKIFDYSDGTHGKRDFNDWAEIDLTYFEIPDE